MKLSILLSVIILSSCGTRTIPVPIALQAPPELRLPHISGLEMQCLTDDVYIRLAQRDRMQTERRKTLREIIESTQK